MLLDRDSGSTACVFIADPDVIGVAEALACASPVSPLSPGKFAEYALLFVLVKFIMLLLLCEILSFFCKFNVAEAAVGAAVTKVD